MTSDHENTKLLILIPCFNEEKNIDRTVSAIIAVLPKIHFSINIILIDDGSTDLTRQKMKALCDKFEFCKMISYDKNHGIGYILLSVLQTLDDNAWVTIVPGDNEIIFESVLNHIRKHKNCDVVLGYLQNRVIRTMFRRFLSDIFMVIVRLLYGFPFKYVNGLVLFKARFFKNIEVVSHGHAFMAELLAKAQLKYPQLRIGETTFVARGRCAGESKAIKMSSVFRAIVETINGYRSVSKYRKEVVKNCYLDNN